MKYVLKVGLLCISFFLSECINTWFLDSIYDIFHIKSVIVLSLNRMCLALLIYYICHIILWVHKINGKDFLNKLFLIYILWFFGVLFGRLMNLTHYNILDHFNFNTYLPLWIHHLDNPLICFYIIGNIVVYIPMGIYIGYYKRGIDSVCLCIILILTFEFIQGITNLGYFDVDDILLNGMGGLLGITSIYLYKKILKINRSEFIFISSKL